VGCGETRAKDALVRLSLDADRVVVDARAVRPGRGAYVCDAGCLRRAVAERALPRAFRQAVVADVDTLELDG
jgi:predicted RNA-binding protein YlxR (DUF448 family)